MAPGAPGAILLGGGIGAGPATTSGAPPPDAYAVLLALGIRGGLSLSADYVWPWLAAAQGVLLLAIAGYLAGNQLSEAFGQRQ
jgi:protein-S-isoprenylcysteine O-methyltransferase Ste14